MLILSKTKRPDNKVIMDIEDLLKSERAKVAALEKELKARDIMLASVCHTASITFQYESSSPMIMMMPRKVRDWFGSYRAKQKRESEQKTSGEAWKV